MKKIAYSMILTLVYVAGCGSDEEEHLSPAADACEHMIEGPSEAITATADSAADAPDLGEEHTRFDITLADAESMKGGQVDLVIDEEGEFTLFLGADVPIEVLASNGSAVAVEETVRNVTECTEVSVGHTFDLGVGTYTVTFGPTAQTMVQLVVIHAGDHAHE